MKRVSHRLDQGGYRLEGGDEGVWLLLSSVPPVPCAEFVPPGLKVDAMASDERKGGQSEHKKKKHLLLLG